MSKPFDATTKRLLAFRPDDWLAFLGLPGSGARVIDADLSTVTANADRLLRVELPTPYIGHIEIEAGKNPARLPDRLLRYNVLTAYEHELPVRSVVILLRREADNRKVLTGLLTYRLPGEEEYLTFRYRIVRVWRLTSRVILRGGVATLPFAPLARDVTAENLPEVIHRMAERIASETSQNEAEDLWAATFVLSGIKYSPEFAAQILRGVWEMKESATYQMILNEGMTQGISQGIVQGIVQGITQGRMEEARRMLLLVGEGKLGKPSVQTAAAIDAISSPARLEDLGTQLLAANSWDELLAKGN